MVSPLFKKYGIPYHDESEQPEPTTPFRRREHTETASDFFPSSLFHDQQPRPCESSLIIECDQNQHAKGDKHNDNEPRTKLTAK